MLFIPDAVVPAYTCLAPEQTTMNGISYLVLIKKYFDGTFVLKKDTRVGNESIRGVSGGEKKRLTLGEMLTSTKSVFLMDSITTGLDSCTTNQIITSLRDYTQGELRVGYLLFIAI